MAKYTIKINDLEQLGNIRKLERDGFSREQIMKQMYKVTDGMQTDDRREIVDKFFNREKDGT